MQTPPEPSGATERTPPRPRRWRRWVLLGLGALGAALVVLLAALAIAAPGIRSELQRGRDALERGKSALVAGRSQEAAQAFDVAEGAFSGAADSSLIGLAGAVPWLGNTADAVRAIAEAGELTSKAASLVDDAVTELPGGLGALAPATEGIPLDQMAGLAKAVTQAEILAGDALEKLRAAPSSLVLPPVASARDEALRELERTHRQLLAGATILRELPSFLGADEPKHYLFGASNPAELRGTGGLIGAYAILTVDDGRLDLSEFRPIQSLPILDLDQHVSPSPEYSTNFDYYRTGLGFWVNANMTPDFPLAAEALWLSYAEATGEELDGVIVADPFALEALMRVTGPVTVRGTGIELTDRTVVPFVTNEAYALFDTNEQRKLVLGRVAQAVLDGFLSEEGNDLQRERAMLRAFDDGHVKVWSAEPDMQSGLELTTAGGAFDPQGTDVVSVITNSASGTKLDFYQGRTVTYEVRLGPGGTATASLRADLRNDSPTSGYPPYVIGPYKTYSTKPGENVAVVDLYCDRGCILQGGTRNGEPVELERYSTDGFPYFEDYVRTPSGDTATIEAQLLLTDAWIGSNTGGTYRLSFVGQSTIRPARVRILIQAPEGMRFTSWSDDLSRQGGSLVFDGMPAANLDLRTTFAPSLPVRLWRSLIDKVT